MRKALSPKRASEPTKYLNSRSGDFRPARYVTWFDAESLPDRNGRHHSFLVCSRHRSPAPPDGWLYSDAVDWDPERFIDRILEPFQKNSHKVRDHLLVAHNAGFDFMAIGLHDRLLARGFEMDRERSIISETSKPFHMIYRKALPKRGYDKRSDRKKTERTYYHTVTITDTGNFFVGSLAALGKDFGAAKGSFQFHDDTTREDFARSRRAAANPDGPEGIECSTYCLGDVTVVQAMYESLEAFMRENQLGPLKPTVAMTALHIFQRRFLPDVPIELHNDPLLFEMEADSYVGGAVLMMRQILSLTPRQITTVRPFQGYQVDFFSMYASVMRDVRLPVDIYNYAPRNLPQPHPTELLKQFGEGRTAIARVTLSIPSTERLPRYPHRYNDTLAFPTGTFTTTLAGAELAHALEHHHVAQVLEHAVYNTEILFKGYVDFFMDLKVKYAAEGNAAFEALAKIFSNALYGKWGQTTEQFTTTPDTPDLQEAFEELDELFETFPDAPYQFYTLNGVTYRGKRIAGQLSVSCDVKHASRHTNMAIAACITAAARGRLFDAAEIAGADTLVYADTDSWIVTDEGYQRLLEADVMGARPGGLTPEMRITGCTVQGLKQYRLEGYKWDKKALAFKDQISVKHRHKGVRIIMDNDGNILNYNPDSDTFTTSVFGKFHPSFTRGQTAGVQVDKIRKKAAPPDYRKGVIGNDGYVTPLHLH